MRVLVPVEIQAEGHLPAAGDGAHHERETALVSHPDLGPDAPVVTDRDGNVLGIAGCRAPATPENSWSRRAAGAWLRARRGRRAGSAASHQSGHRDDRREVLLHPALVVRGHHDVQLVHAIQGEQPVIVGCCAVAMGPAVPSLRPRRRLGHGLHGTRGMCEQCGDQCRRHRAVRITEDLLAGETSAGASNRAWQGCASPSRCRTMRDNTKHPIVASGFSRKPRWGGCS